MRIEKYTKKKNGFYELSFDNSSKIIIHDDLILKYNLLIIKNIDDKLKEQLMSENEHYIIYEKAIKYISSKMRSIYEVECFFKKLGFEKKDYLCVIEKLIEQGYLNDSIFAHSYINDRINLSSDGPNKIILFLKNNKIDDEIIYEKINIFTEDIQIEKINKYILKQINLNSNKGSNLLKQKIMFNLINLGFDRTIISLCLSQFDFNDEELYVKEYNKVRDKLSKKYNGKELEYRIRQKMYQKGFINN